MEREIEKARNKMGFITCNWKVAHLNFLSSPLLSRAPMLPLPLLLSTDLARSFLFHYILPHFTSLAGFASTERRGEKRGGTEAEGGAEGGDRSRSRLASSRSSAPVEAFSAADRKSYALHSPFSSDQITIWRGS